MTRDAGLETLLEEALAQRLPPDAIVTTRPMFGALATMVNGHMLAGAREGRLLLRVGKPNEAEAHALAGVRPMEHGGRRMGGYVWAEGAALQDDATLNRLLDLACDTTLGLPPK